jgi:hypothetical protein
MNYGTFNINQNKASANLVTAYDAEKSSAQLMNPVAPAGVNRRMFGSVVGVGALYITTYSPPARAFVPLFLQLLGYCFAAYGLKTAADKIMTADKSDFREDNNTAAAGQHDLGPRLAPFDANFSSPKFMVTPIEAGALGHLKQTGHEEIYPTGTQRDSFNKNDINVFEAALKDYYGTTPSRNYLATAKPIMTKTDLGQIYTGIEDIRRRTTSQGDNQAIKTYPVVIALRNEELRAFNVRSA